MKHWWFAFPGKYIMSRKEKMSDEVRDINYDLLKRINSFWI